MTTVFLVSLVLATVAAIVSPMGERRRRAVLANASRPCDGELMPYGPGGVVAASRR